MAKQRKRAVTLPPDMYDVLQGMLTDCRETQEFAEKCKAAGLDVSEYCVECNDQIKVASALLAEFFPGGRPQQ